MKLRVLARLMAVLCLATAIPATAQTKLLRFPDIHSGKLVFTYAGDLWSAAASGGTATRLTAHPGLELFAKYSPDGQWIAFTGQYDGDEQVYIIPAAGGVPRQLTWYPARGPLPDRWGYDNQVYGWTPDGKAVVFRSIRDGWNNGDSRLYTVPITGGLPKQLPMPTSGLGDFSPDMKRIVYSPLFRDFRTWKRYQGGWAQDLYIFDLVSHQMEPVSQTPRTERDPMWVGSKICFTSDRSGTLNLYEYDPASKKTRQLTGYTDWDVRWPSRGEGTDIVYEMNGELYVIDSKGTPKPTRVRVDVPDDGLSSRASLMNVGTQVEEFDLSPKGERALLTARGDIFTAPIEKGVPRNLTRTSSAHDKHPAWSPDGQRIAYLSDASGEEEIYVIPQDGSAKAEQFTKDGKAMRYRLLWSPDGKQIAFSDKDGKVYVLKLDDKSITEVADNRRGQTEDYVWSPDSAWLAYSLTNPNGFDSVYIYNLGTKKAEAVTDPLFNATNPAWDPEGNYLYFLSDRDYAPLISAAEFNFATARTRSIHALALRKDVKHPFPPESDEVSVEKKAEEKKDADKKPDVKEVKIDLDGLRTRVARVPVPANNYGALMAIKEHLLYSRYGNPYYGREPETQTALVIYGLKDRKETVLSDNMNGYALSGSGNKILLREGSNFFIQDANPGGKAGRKAVSTAALTVDRVPKQEWVQIFNEVWRRYRDFFYVKNMHGYDWEGLRKKYSPMLEYVGHRADLNYIIGEMISELNVGHAYIAGGDWNRPPRPKVALPGARLELDEAAGRYRIAHIFKGQNEEPVYRSPLTEIGVDVREGDYLLAIDNEEVTATTNPYRLLRGKADQQVRFTVNSKPVAEGARQVVLQPIASESDLLYLEWTQKNRDLVTKLSGGRMGYLHIPDMGAAGIREFIKWYYGQLRKEGMVVDVRSNGGGNVSRMLIERLRRKVLATGFSRTSDDVSTYPDGTFPGPLACILNETSASDGDIFPAMFRQAQLGPLIGKRSWGGVVGITNHGNLIDGGQVNVPEFGFASPDGKWIIEGQGVTPDIVVENDPKLVLDGHDPQLERGVAEVLERMKTNPKPLLPSRPPDPVKTK